MEDISDILDAFTPISLEEANGVKLMNRVDSKFIMNASLLPEILKKATAFYDILEINNSRALDYQTSYFDTYDFFMFHAHQGGKLNRYKIRCREYLINSTNYLEIKFKSNKSRTIKERIKRKSFETDLSKKSKQFIENNSPFEATDLNAKLITHFSRLALIHKKKSERLSVDINLNFSKIDGEKKELPFLCIVEVKQSSYSRDSEFISLLRKAKVYETGMSKYCLGIVLLYKQVKYNRFKSKLLTLKKISNGNFKHDIINN